MKKPPEKIIELMKKHKQNRNDLWECHGNWIIYHEALERIAIAEGITWSFEVIFVEMEKKFCLVKAKAKNGDRIFESLGEAAPYNNKNNHPCNMAEKRAVDRALKKSLNCPDVFSDREADVFQRPSQAEPNTKKGEQLDMKGLKGKMKKAAGL